MLSILTFVEEEQLRRKEELSDAEKAFLCSESASSSADTLTECAAKLYPRFFVKLKSGTVNRDSASPLLVSEGKTRLHANVVANLQRTIQSLYFSIAQVAINMGKFTGWSMYLQEVLIFLYYYYYF